MEFSDISLVNNIVEQIAFGENSLIRLREKLEKKNQQYYTPWIN